MLTKEMFEQIRDHHARGEALVLAVITETMRRTPRGVGSCMLVSKQGLLTGTIGGGPLEGGALVRSAELLETGQSGQAAFGRCRDEIIHPDKKEDGDLLVWFQYIDPKQAIWQELAQAALALLATDAGGWFLLNRQGELPSVLDAQSHLICGKPMKELHCLTGHAPTLADPYFSMPLFAGERVLLFGGGHCAKALVPILSYVGFSVTVIENREAFADPARYPDAQRVLLCEYERFSEQLSIRPDDYIVIMTNGHEHDMALLSAIMGQEYAYLGVMASKSHSAGYRAKLEALGIPEEKIATLHSPIGLKIRGVTPEEIAISVAGEMILQRANIRNPM